MFTEALKQFAAEVKKFQALNPGAVNPTGGPPPFGDPSHPTTSALYASNPSSNSISGGSTVPTTAVQNHPTPGAGTVSAAASPDKPKGTPQQAHAPNPLASGSGGGGSGAGGGAGSAGGTSSSAPAANPPAPPPPANPHPPAKSGSKRKSAAHHADDGADGPPPPKRAARKARRSTAGG